MKNDRIDSYSKKWKTKLQTEQKPPGLFTVFGAGNPNHFN